MTVKRTNEVTKRDYIRKQRKAGNRNKINMLRIFFQILFEREKKIDRNIHR